jgi:hypothetical protein
MRLEDSALVLRRRTPWEALDLGQVMLREWRGPLLRVWAATYLPAALLLPVLLWPWPEYVGLVLWWLKPAFDRVLLFACGHAAFGEHVTVRQVWHALPGLLARTRLLAGLTWLRFSMARSFFLPVWQLEQQHGRAARQRCRVLGARTRPYAAWLTFMLANVASVLVLSVVLLLEFLTPVGAPSLVDWSAWLTGEESRGVLLLFYAGMVLAETVVEPLYVASGFALYLNRRTELEGWDIELGLRHMAQRLETEAVPRGAGSAVLAVAAAWLVAVVLALPVPAQAADLQSPAKQAIREVLADPVFGAEHAGHEWRYREEARDEGAERPAWLDGLQAVARVLAASLRLLAYVALALLAGVLLYLVWRRQARRAAAVPRPPDTLFGLDVRPQSLPADVAGAALAELAAGRPVAALSLLYRGALVALIHGAGIEFHAGDTEADCAARIAGRLGAEREGYFGALLAAWQVAAYGHAPPPAARARQLCEDWRRYFGAGAAA